MSSTGGAPQRAQARLRGFTLLSTVIGLTLIALIGWPLLSSTASPGSAAPSRITTSEDFYDPWDDPSPTAATADGDSWTGRGQQYIPLTGLTPGHPLQLTFDEDSAITDVFLAPTAPTADGEEPVSFETYDPPTYLIPTASEMTVWLRVRTPDEWTVRIAPADLAERSGTASGIGAATFLYSGDATAARITARGAAAVEVTVITQSGPGDASDRFKNAGGTIAWPDTDAAIFIVSDHSDRSSWTIEFFETAGASDE